MPASLGTLLKRQQRHRQCLLYVLAMPHRSLGTLNNNDCIYFLRLRTVIRNEVLVEMILQDLYVGVAIKQV